MKSYQVLEGELEHISMLNWWSTLFFSLAASFATVSFDLWSGMLIEATPGDGAVTQIPPIEKLCVALAGVFLLLALVAMRHKSSEVHRIKRESGDIQKTWKERIGDLIPCRSRQKGSSGVTANPVNQ